MPPVPEIERAREPLARLVRVASDRHRAAPPDLLQDRSNRPLRGTRDAEGQDVAGTVAGRRIVRDSPRDDDHPVSLPGPPRFVGDLLEIGPRTLRRHRATEHPSRPPQEALRVGDVSVIAIVSCPASPKSTTRRIGRRPSECRTRTEAGRESGVCFSIHAKRIVLSREIPRKIAANPR
jgi:hypothetical protein